MEFLALFNRFWRFIIICLQARTYLATLIKSSSGRIWTSTRTREPNLFTVWRNCGPSKWLVLVNESIPAIMPAVPSPSRTTAVVSIGHNNAHQLTVATPAVTRFRDLILLDWRRQGKTKHKWKIRPVFPSTFPFIYSWLSIFLHLSIDKKGKFFFSFSFSPEWHSLTFEDRWMDGLFVLVGFAWIYGIRWHQLCTEKGKKKKKTNSS